jgi:hypothetical protein
MHAMRLAPVLLALAVLTAVSGCGDDSVTTASGTASTAASAVPGLSPTAEPVPSPAEPSPTTEGLPAPSPTSDGLPHFASPQEAATYLATTWNAGDDEALHHITNDDSRAQLADMRTFADDLRLETCTKDPDGAYTCTFDHGFLPGKEHEHVDDDAEPGDEGPAPADDPHHGKAGLRAVAVDRTGWYFNVFLYCG